MKQKLVIKVQMHCEKCRNKALKTAAEVKGVTSVSLDGEEKDRVVVNGNNVDTVCLANQLKKKFRCVTILSVEEVKKPPPKKEEKKEEKPKVEKKEEKPKCCAILCLPPPCEPSTKCHGKCESCSKCHGKCESCSKCQSPKCHCKCEPCPKCRNSKCDGQCIICFKCHNPKCHGQCSSPSKPPPAPCSTQCPPWCTCSRCYVPYPPCNYPCTYKVVYDPNPDSCFIM